MNKAVSLFILLFFFLISQHAAGSFGGRGSVLEEIYLSKQSIVEVRADNISRAGRTGFVRSVRRGAGVIMDNAGSILTNKHIVHSASRIIVRLNDGREYEATSGVTSNVFDLAIVKIIPAEEIVPIELAEDIPAIGENVYSVGSSFWRKGSIISGKLTAAAVNRFSGNKEQLLIRSTIKMDRGDSGAPLLNGKGRLVGLIFGKMGRRGTVALPANVVEGFYKSYAEQFLSPEE